MRLRRLFLFGLTAGAALVPAAAGAAVFLAPHRAVYDLELNEANDRSGITDVTGRIVYEFTGSACQGYTVKYRFVMRIDSEETSRLSDAQTTTYEDGTGDLFRFSTKFFVDQKSDREVKGSAERITDSTEVELEQPKRRDLKLQRSQFPTQHLMELIEKAEKSENFYETTVFDASDDADAVMTTTVVVGSKKPVTADDPEIGALSALATDQYWPVDIAYFDLSDETGEELPNYRISFKLHANGVTRDMMMDYGDFSAIGHLVELDLFDADKDSCETR